MGFNLTKNSIKINLDRKSRQQVRGSRTSSETLIANDRAYRRLKKSGYVSETIGSTSDTSLALEILNTIGCSVSKEPINMSLLVEQTDTESIDNENIIDQGMITMKSTQKKKSNEWLQKLKSKTVMVEGKAQIPPFYLNVYRLNTTRQESGKYKFFGWQIKFEGYLTKQSTVDQTKAFAHLAKDFNLYYESSSEEGGEMNTAKSSDKVPF